MYFLKKERLAELLNHYETKKALNKKAKKLKKYIKKAFYNEAIKVFSNEIVNGEKSNIIDVDANILILHMLYKKGNKKTEIMMNNLTDKSIVSVDVIPLSDDKITEFVGSWKFIIGFCIFLFAWMMINTYLIK